MGEPTVRHLGGRHGAPLCVVAHAARNGLGASAYQTWAFRRADLTAFRATPFRCENGQCATMAQVRFLEPRTQGTARLSALLGRLVQDLKAPLGGLGAGARVALALALPERLSGKERAARQALAELEHAGTDALGALGLAPLFHPIARGHAGFAFALLEAHAALAKGAVDAAVVGGLDTGYDADVVEARIVGKTLFDGENPRGVIAGEGGALLLLLRRDVAKSLRWPVHGTIESIAVGREPATAGSEVGCLGLGLSRPARAIADRLVEEGRQIDWWLTDLTPEPLRVQELQLAWPRVAAGAMPPEARFELLYEHLGDLGAAAMPTGVTLAIEGFRRGDPAGQCCVVTGSSDGGDRGVVLVAVEPGPPR